MHHIKSWNASPLLTGISKLRIYGLQAFCEIRNSYRSNTDVLGIWESNMPIYYLPSMNVLPDFIHLCCANYEPTQRAVMAPSGTILFYITPQSINEMLNFKPSRPLAPLTMKFLLDQGAKLPNLEITRIAQLFMKPNCHPNSLLHISILGSMRQGDSL